MDIKNFKGRFIKLPGDVEVTPISASLYSPPSVLTSARMISTIFISD